ncbi:hypothetical protein VP01_1850g5 [Puccinia sorghi]|uniref:Adenosinetriphosphatase n=1 Tax=Puccinia sorghi TaxID=27349 RepID=A0A0L6VE75_9BASI|nr:hypothetical protein VP01_1850g5 [Puccinia sorghi]
MDKYIKSPVAPLSTPSKRARSSPPSSSRFSKKPLLTRARSSAQSSPARKSVIIDLDSFDDTEAQPGMSTSSSAKKQPIVINVDSSDDDYPQVTKINAFRKSSMPSQADHMKKQGPSQIKAPADAHIPQASSDNDEDVVWLSGVGPVPLSQYRRPNPTTKLVPNSQFGTSLQNRETPLHQRSLLIPSGPPPDKKPLTSQASSNQLHPFFDNKLTAKHSMPPVPIPDRKPLPFQASPYQYGVDPLSDTKPFWMQSMPSGPTPDRKPLPWELSPYHFAAGASHYPSLDHKPTTSYSTPSITMPDRKPPISQLSPYQNLLDAKPTAQDLFHSLGLSDPSTSFSLLNRPEFSTAENHEFLRQAVQNMDFTHNATVTSARKELGLTEGDDQLLDGLAIQLMAHQLIGVAWMVKQEKSKNMGGILGDEMGLGKTVQIFINPQFSLRIATMVKNCSTDSKIKATLILAPLALLTQWKEEIADRSTCDLSVLIYHSSSKPDGRKKISDYDVVITTLDTLRRDWNDDEDSARPKKPRGLYKIDWYRVVIDEAQIIRNRTAKKSEAVCALNSVYRWCLTGTPIFNTLWDLFPYLRFLRIRPYNDVQQFRHHIAYWEKKRPELATKRAQAVLGTCMLRRQKNTKLDGKLLIVLPPKHEEDIMLDMTPDEREIYEMLEKRAQQKFNVFLRKGTVLKSLAIEEDESPQVPDPTSDPEFNDPDRELERATAERGQQWVDNVKHAFLAETNELVKAEKADCNEAAAPECPGPIQDDSITNPAKIPKPCPNCRAPICRMETYLKKAFLPPVYESENDDEDLPDSGVVLNRKMRNGIVGDSDDEKLVKGEDIDKLGKAGLGFVPSTKLVWLMKQILKVQKECPTDKFIVVSQWTGMLALCGIYLAQRGIRYVTYQGDMNTAERTTAVRSFKRNPEYSIMLMSLKCGGVGLNLTCANRVVSLDLAWTPASEKQAFDRAHRFGQEKEVFVNRVMIKNTVEQRILDLQRKKQEITDHTLGEGSGTKLKRMTVGELASLFNLNTQGETLS